jgi:DNA-binding transcriptional LysR family regulator
MDIENLRTFLAIYDSGSFQAASERVNVTQSTVSMRIKALEERLGVRLFERSKAGASPTVQGRRFLRYARAAVLAWEEGRQQVAIPASFDTLLSIGGQYSLWDTLLADYLPRLRKRLPRAALRAEAAAPFGLMRRLSEGLIDLAILYRPEAMPNLRVEELVQDELVLVTTDPQGKYRDRFVQVDWGRAFSDENIAAMLDIVESGVTIDLGARSAQYLVDAAAAGYMPRRMVQNHLAARTLFLAPDAPSFPDPVYFSCQARGAPAELEDALEVLRALV